MDFEEILERKKYYLSKRFFKDNKVKLIVIFIIIAILSTSFVYMKKKTNNIENKIFSQDDFAEKEKDKVEEFIIIDISGAVASPGVFELPKDSRLDDAIKAGGGLLEEGDISKVNRASILQDGQKIYIPRKDENFSSQQDNREEKRLVNLNSATSEELRQINGIGPAMAERIITYRGENGSFKSVDELKNVEGIGDKTFEKLKKFFEI